MCWHFDWKKKSADIRDQKPEMAIDQAFVCNPKILLLDNTASALDIGETLLAHIGVGQVSALSLMCLSFLFSPIMNLIWIQREDKMTVIIFLDRFVTRTRIISHSGQKAAYCSVTIFSSLPPHHHNNDFHPARLAGDWAGTMALREEEHTPNSLTALSV